MYMMPATINPNNPVPPINSSFVACDFEVVDAMVWVLDDLEVVTLAVECADEFCRDVEAILDIEPEEMDEALIVEFEETMLPDCDETRLSVTRLEGRDEVADAVDADEA
jgi:hypothetical protein